MLAQLMFDIKTIVKDKLYYAVVIVLAAMFIVPLVYHPLIVYGGDYNIQAYRANYQIALQNASSGVYDDKPEEIIANEKARLVAFQNIILGHSTINTREQVEAMLELEKLNMVGSSSSEIESEASIAHLSQHLEKGIYTFCEEPEAMPSINYLAYQLRILPTAFLFLPIIVIASTLLVSINRTKSRQFDLGVPLSKVKMYVVHVVAGTGLSLFALLVATVPALIVAGVKNGAGRLDYPVVSLLPSGLWVGDMGAYLTKFLLLLLVGSLLVAALMLLVSLFVDNRIVIIIAALAVISIPGLASYFDPLGGMAGIIKWLPPTYFQITAVIGTTDLLFFENSLTWTGIDFATGMLVQLCALVLLLGMSALVPRLLRGIQKMLIARKE